MLNKIKSNSFMGWAAIFTVLFLAPNTYFVYHYFSVFVSPWREIASLGVALIIAASILIYTLRRNFVVAKYYTFFEILISSYYYINTIGWDWGLIPAFGFTLILPISVYYYSREFDSDINNSPIQNLQYHYDHNELTNKISELQQENSQWATKYQNDIDHMATQVCIANEERQKFEHLLEKSELFIKDIESINADYLNSIENLKFRNEHLEKQLNEFHEKYKDLDSKLVALKLTDDSIVNLSGKQKINSIEKSFQQSQTDLSPSPSDLSPNAIKDSLQKSEKSKKTPAPRKPRKSSAAKSTE